MHCQRASVMAAGVATRTARWVRGQVSRGRRQAASLEETGQARANSTGLTARWWRGTVRMVEAVVMAVGLLAVAHLGSRYSDSPLVCVVQVIGSSMAPTLESGDQVVFARLPWHAGSIVLAEVGEDERVIKRVAATKSADVHLVGDNVGISEVYDVPGDCIQAILVCRVPFSSPFAHDEGNWALARRAPKNPQ